MGMTRPGELSYGGPVAGGQAEGERMRSLWRRTVSRLARDPIGFSALLVAGLVVAGAVLAPLYAPHDPNSVNLRQRLSPPFWMEGAREGHPLGTDQLGRDTLSRVIYGARSALLVSGSAVLLATLLGVVVGLAAGYLGGPVDSLLMTVVDVMLAFPTILLALAIVAVLGPSIPNLIVAIALTNWTSYARVVRSVVLSLKAMDFVESARALGAGPLRIMLRHILPNVLPTVIVLSTTSLARFILTESSLSYLGLGIPPEIPGWGLMLAEAQVYLQRAWWLALWPGLALMVTTLSINLAGDRLRDILDVRRD